MNGISKVLLHISSSMEILGFYYRKKAWYLLPGLLLWAFLPATIALFFILVGLGIMAILF